MYVAPRTDWDWLRIVQRKLYAQSEREIHYVFCKLWGLVTDTRNLQMALARVASNRGRNTAGVDGVTVGQISKFAEIFIAELRSELRSNSYRPSPVRRVLIPKIGAPGKFRPLGIPTVKDRVVQAALKNILEPIFEADFYPISYGFRPGKSVHEALEQIRVLLRPKDDKQGRVNLPYQWIVEGDIKGCFDNIDHHGLMKRVRRRIEDPKVNRLILMFLKAGILSENAFVRSDAGTPQGGILSPLLANIALSVIEERYERHTWQRRLPPTRKDAPSPEMRAKWARQGDRRRGQTIIIVPIRYADDFLLLVGAPPGPGQDVQARMAAETERVALASLLKQELGLELSEQKTLITPVTKVFKFLGHHVVVRKSRIFKQREGCVTLIPKEKSHQLRERIKRHCRRSSTGQSLKTLLRELNWLIRGWSSFYCHAWGAKRVLCSIDHYSWWSVYRWVCKKHPKVSVKRIRSLYPIPRNQGIRRKQWHHDGVTLFVAGKTPVGPFRRISIRPPLFAIHHGEPGA
jgi:RNA-directed DNA polymerase